MPSGERRGSSKLALSLIVVLEKTTKSAFNRQGVHWRTENRTLEVSFMRTDYANAPPGDYRVCGWPYFKAYDYYGTHLDGLDNMGWCGPTRQLN